MKLIGADLSPEVAAAADTINTVVLVDDAGAVQAIRRPSNLPAVAAEIVELAGAEPFLAGIGLPVVVPHSTARQRPVEGLIRRKLGVRLPPGGRAVLSAARGGLAGEALLAALAAAGHPCLPYPDRDGRRTSVAEIHPGLAAKALLWEGSPAARAAAVTDRAAAFRAYAPPDFRAPVGRSRAALAERSATLDLVSRALARIDGFDMNPLIEQLAIAATDVDLRRAASLLDACLIAGTARRYLRDVEACVFVGDRENGYVIVPADGLVRRLALGDAPSGRGRLFPKGSLRERLGSVAKLRSADLLEMPGRPHKLEAVFQVPPAYEFENLDELLWWKHCRHVSGATIPTEGLDELVVELSGERAPQEERSVTLRLVRSRHRTLSFRFDPPAAWRSRVPTRDGRTYPFRVLRATFLTTP